MRKIRVKVIGIASVIIAILLTALCVVMFSQAKRQFSNLEAATETYITCENNAEQLRHGSDVLTEQVRLATLTGRYEYVEGYFNEANTVKSRENALQSLKERIDETDLIDSFQSAMDQSNQLMVTEIYALRLICEANDISTDLWQTEVKNVLLSAEDSLLTKEEKKDKAQQLVSDENYKNARDIIQSKIEQTTTKLVETTENEKTTARSLFSNSYWWLVFSVIAYVVILMSISLLLWKSIIGPVVNFNERIKKGETLPIIGAVEIRNLAKTYNEVYERNEASQEIIEHQAEYDGLTDLLNRRSFDKLYENHVRQGEPFALVLADVDNFKAINDTYGHAEGDRVLKYVANTLKTAFRSNDFVFRIGGDEFAIIMVSMTSEYAHIVEKKINAINQELAEGKRGMPRTSLSVGVALTDRKDPTDNIFKDADKALYKTKENGRCGCTIYGQTE